MIRVFRAKLVFTNHWLFWMEILKASIFSSENYYATMTPALCKVYIFVTVCYAHVYRLICGNTLNLIGALYSFSWWLLWESIVCWSPWQLLGRRDGLQWEYSNGVDVDASRYIMRGQRWTIWVVPLIARFGGGQTIDEWYEGYKGWGMST